MDNSQKIASALQNLLASPDPNAFVVFKEENTGKFVQFALLNRNLIMDLPAQALDRAELIRATQLFQKLGVPGAANYPVFTDQTLQEVAGHQITFNLNFRDQIGPAARVTQAIFQFVYGFVEPMALKIETD